MAQGSGLSVVWEGHNSAPVVVSRSPYSYCYSEPVINLYDNSAVVVLEERYQIFYFDEASQARYFEPVVVEGSRYSHFSAEFFELQCWGFVFEGVGSGLVVEQLFDFHSLYRQFEVHDDRQDKSYAV